MLNNLYISVQFYNVASETIDDEQHGEGVRRGQGVEDDDDQEEIRHGRSSEDDTG